MHVPRKFLYCAFLAVRSARTASSPATSFASLISEKGMPIVCGSSSPASSMRRSASPLPTPSIRPLNRFLPLDQLLQLYLRLMTGERREIAWPHQRPVDARRRDLEPVAARHRIERFEQRRKLAADRCAIVDGHLTVRPVRHHLHRSAVTARNLHPHEAEAKFVKHRLGEIGDLAFGAALLGKAAISA